MSQYATENPKNIVPFDSSTRAREPDALDLDRSGQAIIALLQEAADAVRANEDRAMSVAQKLSGQIQTVEDRAKQLEADVRYHQIVLTGPRNGCFGSTKRSRTDSSIKISP